MKDNLTIPIYLNQKYVFDLLAIIEDGISQIEKVKMNYTDSVDNTGNIKGEIGINNVFAFLKFGGEGELSRNKTNKEETISEKEKIHTPNSLFSKLRFYLLENNYIKNDNYLEVKPGDFIEIELSLYKNPLIETLDSFSNLIKLVIPFTSPTSNQKQSKPNGNQKKSGEHKVILDQIESLTKQLKEEGSLDLIGDSINVTDLKIVLNLDVNFIDNFSLSSINDGNFSVLGKVINIIKDKEHDGINLLRKTSLSKFDSSKIEEMLKAFNGMGEFGLKFEEIVTEIKPPVIQVIPIAIFT